MYTPQVLDSGHDATVAVPIYEGHTIPHAAVYVDIAGTILL